MIMFCCYEHFRSVTLCRETASRQVHNLEIVGSIPTTANSLSVVEERQYSIWWPLAAQDPCKAASTSFAGVSFCSVIGESADD